MSKRLVYRETDIRGEDGYNTRTTRGGDYGTRTTVYHEVCGEVIQKASVGNSAGWGYFKAWLVTAKEKHTCEERQ